MKPLNRNTLMWALVSFLALSLVLNWIQSRHIEQLRQDLKQTENLQNALTDYIDTLEEEGAGDECESATN